MDETDTVYGSDVGDMDGLLVLFEYLFCPHTSVGEELGNHSAEVLENEISIAEAMAFVLMQTGFDMGDSSSDEDIYIP